MPQCLPCVASLPVEQGVLLWCMRMWVIDMKQGIGAESRIAAMLDELGAGPASQPLKLFMKTLSREATRMIDVQCVCAADVGPDEDRLLRVFSLAQSLRSWEAVEVLRGFTSAAGSQTAVACAEKIGTSLLRLGYSLPTNEDQTAWETAGLTAAAYPKSCLH